MSDTVSWVKNERKRLGWTAEEAADRIKAEAHSTGDELNLTQQAISFFENGKTKSIPRWVRYFERAVRMTDLTRGKHLDAEYEDVAHDVRSGRQDVFGVSADEVAEQLDAVMLPEVQVSFSMGGGSVVEDWPVIQMVPFSRAWLRGLTSSAASELMVARGDGDSMMPTILDQDLVIIDRAQNTPRQQDRIWAMSYGGLGMIKRLRALPDGSFEINSDNKEVSAMHAVDGELHIVGRVVAIVRKI